MGCGHDHGPVRYDRSFAIGVALNVIFVVIEFRYGLLTGSLALLADAGHNLGDVFGLLIAWAGHALGRVKPAGRQTYGWGSASILATAVNGWSLVVLGGVLAFEAVSRFQTPMTPPGATIAIIAGIGVVINLGTALLFLRGRDKDINIRGAYLHMLADAAVSLGVVIGGVLIPLTGWGWIDPALSLVIAILIVIGSWGIAVESIRLLLHAVPQSIDPEAVRSFLENEPEVISVERLHIWALSTTHAALTAHLVLAPMYDAVGLVERLQDELHDRFEITNPTIQVRYAEPVALER